MEALLVDNSSAHLEMGLGLAGPRGGEGGEKPSAWMVNRSVQMY